MGKYPGCQSHSYAFSPQGKQQGESDRQCQRLFIAPVIGHLKFCEVRGEEHLFGEFCKPGFNVAGRGRGIIGYRVAPVTLGVD